MSDLVVITEEDEVVVLTPAAGPSVVVITAARGPAGAAGVDGTGDKFYEHDQGLPSAAWTVTHNLDKFPSVSVIDSLGQEVQGQVVYISGNQLTISFNAAFSGTAYLN